MHQSITWLSWCKDVFDKSFREKKPIIMDLTSHWGNWCKIMNETTYLDVQVIELINKFFIPLRVDVDQYPHIGDRYHQGGYPSVVFLTCYGDIIWAENYLSRDDMLSLLDEVMRNYHKEKAIPQIVQLEKQKCKKELHHDTITFSLEKQGTVVWELIKKAFDEMYGGFALDNFAPKFPNAEINQFLIKYLNTTNHSDIKKMLSKTLDAMYYGEIHDCINGGVFRFCSNRDWTNPRYEKMLETNAKILRNYLEAYEKLGVKRYRDAAQSILFYVINHLFLKKHQAFGGSQAGEKNYYKFRAKNNTLIPPTVDETIFTNWNGMMVSALCTAHHVLEKKDYLELALMIIDSLWDKCYNFGRGMSHFYNEKSSEVELFSDQVYFTKALMDAYDITGVISYLEKARLLLKNMYKHYWIPGAGFADIPFYHEKWGYLNIEYKPIVDNAEAAVTLIKMADISGEKIHEEKARAILCYLSTMVDNSPIISAKYGDAVIELIKFQQKKMTSQDKQDSLLQGDF